MSFTNIVACPYCGTLMKPIEGKPKWFKCHDCGATHYNEKKLRKRR